MHTHLCSLPVSSALVALEFLTFEGMNVSEDQVGLCCHGNHLPAVVPLSLRVVHRCPALSVAQGYMNLPVFSQHLNATGDRHKNNKYSPVRCQQAVIK